MASKKPASPQKSKAAAATPFTLEQVPGLLAALLASKAFAATPDKISKACYHDHSFRRFAEPEVHRNTVLVALAVIGRRDLAEPLLAAQPESWRTFEALRIDARTGGDISDQLAALLPGAGDPVPVLRAFQAELTEAKQPAAAQLRACITREAEALLATAPDVALELLLAASTDLRRVATLATGAPISFSRSVSDLCERLLDAGQLDAAFAVLEHVRAEVSGWRSVDRIFTGARLRVPAIRERALAFVNDLPDVAEDLAQVIQQEDDRDAACRGVYPPPGPYDPELAQSLLERGERDAARRFLGSREAPVGRTIEWSDQLHRAGLIDVDTWMAAAANNVAMGEAHRLLIEGRRMLASDPQDPGLDKIWRRLEALLAAGPVSTYDHGVFYGRVGEALAFGADVARVRGADPGEVLARERAFVATAKEPREILVHTIPAWGRAGRIDGALTTLAALTPDQRASMAGRVAEACTDPAEAWAAIVALTDKRPFIAPQLLARLIRRVGTPA